MNFKEIACDKECRFQTGASSVTAMYFPPTYNKNGENINPDGNVETCKVWCTECGRQWTARTQYGKTGFLEVPND